MIAFVEMALQYQDQPQGAGLKLDCLHCWRTRRVFIRTDRSGEEEEEVVEEEQEGGGRV